MTDFTPEDKSRFANPLRILGWFIAAGAGAYVLAQADGIGGNVHQKALVALNSTDAPTTLALSSKQVGQIQAGDTGYEQPPSYPQVTVGAQEDTEDEPPVVEVIVGGDGDPDALLRAEINNCGIDWNHPQIRGGLNAVQISHGGGVVGESAVSLFYHSDSGSGRGFYSVGDIRLQNIPTEDACTFIRKVFAQIEAADLLAGLINDYTRTSTDEMIFPWGYVQGSRSNGYDPETIDAYLTFVDGLSIFLLSEQDQRRLFCFRNGEECELPEIFNVYTPEVVRDMLRNGGIDSDILEQIDSWTVVQSGASYSVIRSSDYSLYGFFVGRQQLAPLVYQSED